MSREGRIYREAFVAARFAEYFRADAVRLITPDGALPTPDFELRIKGVVERFEVTEADRPGRKRTDEYKTEIEDQKIRYLSDHECTSSNEYQKVVRYLTLKSLESLTLPQRSS